MTNPRTGHHSGSLTPYLVSHALGSTSRVGSSFAEQRIGVCGGLPSVHSRRLCLTAAFGGKKREAPPYPSRDDLSRFGSTSCRSHRPSLDGTFAVELFAVRAFHAKRRSGRPRNRGNDPRLLPAPAALNEPDGTCTRIAPEGFGPDPAGGIREGPRPSTPASMHDGSHGERRHASAGSRSQSPRFRDPGPSMK